MGTSRGNYGRAMYSDPAFKAKISAIHLLKRIVVTKVCSKCGSKFDVERKISKSGEVIIDRDERKFCSRKCANSKVWNEEDKLKKSLSAKKRPYRICPSCGKEFNSKQQTCSLECSSKYRYRHIDKESLRYYRLKCKFEFALKDYPEEFEFSLIEEYGWYKAKNHGDNQNGVSRDHMVSVKYGWENKIDPSIIKHPANCRLLRHSSNVSKFDSCSITLDELLIRIENWDKKYMGH